MPHAPGTLRRDPLSIRYDQWARTFLEDLKDDPWEWHGRTVRTEAPNMLLGTDTGGLSRDERAAIRSLYWNLTHAASSGLRIRSAWSLQAKYGPAVRIPPTRPGGILWARSRLLTARVTPRAAGQRAVLIRGRGSYIARPTSRGQLDGDRGDWKPKG